MRLSCHQCDSPVTPDLPDFRFDAYVLCLDCAAENAGRADGGEEGFVEAVPTPDPYLANILGEMVVPTDAGRLDACRAEADDALGRWADEFRAALPAIRDAYRALTAAQRAEFAEMLRTFFRARSAAHDGVDNPYAAFDVGFRVNVLDPSGRYPGYYAGRGWRDAGPWLDLVELAAAAWGRGRTFDPTRAECVELLRRPPSNAA